MSFVLLIAAATFASTFLGGLFALKLRDKLHLILGFSAGAIVGVAFFDLLPEALNLSGRAHSPSVILSLTGLGFVVYLTLDRLLELHGHDDDEAKNHRALAGAGSLSIHSFLDGIGIGLAFHVSSVVGVIVAAAVLAHDFSDGINTVNMIIKNGGLQEQAMRWLFIDAAAPVVGVIVTMFFTISEASLGLLLALFAGFFLYIGASDLIPESHHKHPTDLTTYMTILGMAVMYFVVRLATV